MKKGGKKVKRMVCQRRHIDAKLWWDSPFHTPFWKDGHTNNPMKDPSPNLNKPHTLLSRDYFTCPNHTKKCKSLWINFSQRFWPKVIIVIIGLGCPRSTRKPCYMFQNNRSAAWSIGLGRDGEFLISFVSRRYRLTELSTNK